MKERCRQCKLFADEYEKLGGDDTGDINLGTFKTLYAECLCSTSNEKPLSMKKLEEAIKRKNMSMSGNKRSRR